MITIVLIVILFCVIVLLMWLHFSNLQKIRNSREQILQLEHLLDEERGKGKKEGLQEKYKKLEAKVKDLNASAQTIGSAATVEEQIVQLEAFFESHFKTKPPYVSRFCQRMRRMIIADERIQQLHEKIMRPLQEMLYTQEVTDNLDVQRLVIARMIDAFWTSFDAIETIADGDNIRSEQQLAIDLLSGRSTKLEIMSRAKTITTDPEQTPKWVRVIRRAVLPLKLDEQYPVLYSGYKLNIFSEDENSSKEGFFETPTDLHSSTDSFFNENIDTKSTLN